MAAHLLKLKMKAPQKIVAFVDILGFSALIKEFDSGRAPQILDELRDAYTSAAEFMKPRPVSRPDEPFFQWKDCLETRLFSDCLCAAAPLEYKSFDFITQFQFLYLYLSTYQDLLMGKGFFTRGAITIGSHFADEHMIFSGGLVETYLLETKSANFPRIILSDTIKAKLAEYKKSHREKLNYMLIEDADGYTFLNSFNADLSTAKEVDRDVAKLLPGIGTMDTSFEELSLQARAATLDRMKGVCEDRLNNGVKGSVADKYLWFLDFIDYVAGVANRRRFKEWC